MDLLSQIAEEINIRSLNYNIGKLQEFRKKQHNLKRLPSRWVFDQRTVFEEWGWHYGGRSELQFNIGIEGDELRYGVAFSLECSKSLPSIDVLLPKIVLFNEYIAEHCAELSDLRMWYYNELRSTDNMPSIIPEELVKEGIFIFLGDKQSLNNLDYPLILSTLDRLLPLYQFTENVNSVKGTTNDSQGFHFKPGFTDKLSSTVGKVCEKTLNIRLLHNDLQRKLYKSLIDLHGEDNVGTEISTNGNSIDLVVKNEDEYWFYEIKTASTARGCLRQSLGQIFEYSYWPSNQQATRLFIVGFPAADDVEQKYIDYLKYSLNLPIDYIAIDEL